MGVKTGPSSRAKEKKVDPGSPFDPLSGGPPAEVLTGHLEGVDGEGRILFRAENENQLHPVAIGISLPDDALVRAASLGQRAVVARTTEPRPRLILMGLVRERVSAAARNAEPGRIEAQIDGETVKLEGKEKVELRCGKARIVLHRSGRIELSGTYLLSRSRGPIKLKGATVAIN